MTTREKNSMTAFILCAIVLAAAWLFGFALRAPLSSVDIRIVQDPGLPLVFTGGIQSLTEATLIVGVAAAAYFGCAWALRRGFPYAFPMAVGSVVVAVIAIMPMMPLTSPDSVHLASDVRALWLHGRYPTSDAGIPETLAAETGDPIAEQVRDFRRSPSSYGPVSYGLGGLALPFVGDSLRANIAGTKAVAGLFLVLTAYLGGLAARQVGRDPGLVAGLIGLNPLMLWEFAGTGHNDTIMAAFGVAAFIFIARETWRHRAIGTGLGAASVLAKFGIAPVAPLVGVYWFPKLRLVMVAAVLVAGVLLVWAVVGGLDRQVGPAAVVTRGGWRVAWDWIGGQQTLDRRWIVGAAYGLFMLIAAYMTWKSPLRTAHDLIAAAGILLFFFIFLGYAGYRPWYQVWFFPFAMIAGVSWLTRASVLFTFGGFLIVFAANWQGDIQREMNINNPLEKASIAVWLAVGATALATWWYDRQKALVPVATRPSRHGRPARRKPMRSR